ncbi:Swt1 family HEPN domain-containing protein [Arthrobacter sp. NPDC057388]|uniref:Swt1 family HEPN domain-containing protein n=1 Tax=Arthrobacter sp. NPDC057388 TaxID=3346116 RepID=UPI00363C5F39
MGYPFNLAHAARRYTSELRNTRNLLAHNEVFDDDTYRALDIAGRLAKHLKQEEASLTLSVLLEESWARITGDVKSPIPGT